MNLSELCVRRPVFATVLSLVLVLVGVVSYTRLTVREYPNIDEPVISVRTNYTGASAEIIESQVTQILEGSIAGIEGIKVLTSVSRPESSRISITFHESINPDVAASDVRDRVSRVRRRLPEEVDEPTIAKVEADARAIIYVSFWSDTLSPLEITDYLDRYVVDKVKNLLGVADVEINGERRYAMRVWVDRARLAAYSLTVQDIENALQGQNVEIPAGRIESVNREFTVLPNTGLSTPEEFQRIVVKRADGMLVRLKDVATVELAAEEERRSSRYNGQTSVSIGVIKQATANPLDVSKGLREMLPSILGNLPEGMKGEVAYDSSVFIERSIQSVFMTIGEAIVLVVLVILFFLRNLRATLIPLVTIPVSLVTACALMYAFGFTINTLTLLAMVLAIGLVVDDAIVVLENVYRHLEEGKTPFRAAIDGAKEISFAVVAMTLTLAAVYAPIAFAEGRTGRLFLEFALSLAGAVMVSGFMALTLSPMMCSKLLKRDVKHGFVFRMLEGFLNGLSRGYDALLRASLSFRPLVVLVALAVAGSCWFLFGMLKSELAPIEDRGVVFAVGNAPEGSTLDYTMRYARDLEKIYEEIPEAEAYFLVAGWGGVTRFFSMARLDEWENRTRSQQEIVASLFPKLSQIPGARIFANNPPPFGQRISSRPVEYVIQAGTYEELQKHVDTMLEHANASPLLQNVDTDLTLNKPQLEVEVNRDKILDSGLQIEDIGRTLETLLGGRVVNRFDQNGEQYDVILQLDASDRATPSDLSSIYVRSSGGTMVQLSNLVTIKETVAPKELNRFNQMRAAEITAMLAPGVSLGEALDFLDRTAREVLPQNVQTAYDGQSQEFKEAGSSLYFVFVLALMFIYLVLAAQFESFIDPLIILFTVPLSMAGALFALYHSGGSLNVYSQIGLVTLVGLITKHGILIVEFANQLRERGVELREAVIESAVMRLRPILMTTGAMVLGSIPLALAEGAGAESRQQIGWVIVGGMSFGTLLTLFVVPTAYTLLARRHRQEDEEGVAAPAAAE